LCGLSITSQNQSEKGRYKYFQTI